MEDKKAPSNVIQFPGGKKKENEDNSSVPTTTSTSSMPLEAPKRAAEAPVPKPKTKATIAGGVLAIALFTGAVNRYAFSPAESLDASSYAHGGRAIASVEAPNWPRDAGWEKQLAESLASPQARGVASSGIGHAASPEEKLRWGTLEEKYTIVFKTDVHRIDSIMLQDAGAKPTYILDRAQFLRDYGQLFDAAFASAELKSTEAGGQSMFETYTFFDKNNRVKGEARFELDRHKRLLSLKVNPVQI